MKQTRLFKGFSYYLIDSMIYQGHTYHLWESEVWGEELPAIITRGHQRILDSWDGFNDLYEYLEGDE